MTIAFDEDWPAQETEEIPACPYCGSRSRDLAYENVRDWSFQCAPGKWSYWDCVDCQSLYLNPRPTIESVGAAYAHYYTHGDAPVGIFGNLKYLLRNECLSYRFNVDITPRLGLPSLLRPVLQRIAHYIKLPFGWTFLESAHKGRFIDVGCGDGRTVALAKQLGWKAMGVEIDPAAVTEARRKNLDVVEGTYAALATFPYQFDCIVCSHVLEHVHDPLDLLRILRNSLAPGGMLLLTLPNASSALRRHFGENWRGLEAPRHISIPSELQLRKLLEQLEFEVHSYADNEAPTAAESYRIQRRSQTINREDRHRAQHLKIVPLDTPNGNDFIKFACFAQTVREGNRWDEKIASQ